MVTRGQPALSTDEDMVIRVSREKLRPRVATPLLKGRDGRTDMTQATQGGGTFF
jgi:hypothetical protein